VDRITRHELKTDKFVEEAKHTVEYVSEHRQQLIRYASIAAGVIVLIGLIWLFIGQRRESRQAALKEAMKVTEASVGAAPPGAVGPVFANQGEKDAASLKALTAVATNYAGSAEGRAARYMAGTLFVDQGNLGGAEKAFAEVATGSDEYASLAKLSLSQVYASTGKVAEAEKLLRGMIDKPTLLVSKEQATIALARIIGRSKPEEARKLLLPLQGSDRSAVSRAALNALGEISQ
jgi:predicted negative regulator of RcsB-dependent stress response